MRFTRRRFLSLAAAGGLGAVLPGCSTSERFVSFLSPVAKTLERFVDALPIPPVLRSIGTDADGEKLYQVVMSPFRQVLHRDLPATLLWGYNGTYPGPTIEARVGELIRVLWVNGLPLEHLFLVDPTIHCGQNAPNCSPAVRTVVHVHGGNQPADSDGYPEDWIVPGESQLFTYPNNQLPTTLWYHDHALGITRLNVYAGLAGFKIVRDAAEEALNLPSGAYEVPILIQDRTFNDDGSLFYPRVGDDPDAHPFWVPEYFADTAVVNGKVWPHLEVEPRKYRFRLLNGCNARFLTLTIDQGPPFQQIGSDGGLLPAPVTVNPLTLAPAERADVVVDFSGYAGQSLILTNNAPAPFPDGGEVELPDIMQFRVGAGAVADPSVVPAVLTGTAARIPEGEAIRTVDFTLNESLNAEDNSLILLLDEKRWDDALGPKDMPRLGTTEIWRLINTTGDTHPIHVHLVEFQILDRQPYDTDLFDSTGTLQFTGPAVPPDDNEMGWKDTVRCPPGEVTRIIIRWEGFSGRYVWHCHILEHEDNEMMRPLEVLPEL